MSLSRNGLVLAVAGGLTVVSLLAYVLYRFWEPSLPSEWRNDDWRACPFSACEGKPPSAYTTFEGSSDTFTTAPIADFGDGELVKFFEQRDKVRFPVVTAMHGRTMGTCALNITTVVHDRSQEMIVNALLDLVANAYGAKATDASGRAAPYQPKGTYRVHVWDFRERPFAGTISGIIVRSTPAERSFDPIGGISIGFTFANYRHCLRVNPAFRGDLNYLEILLDD